MKKLYYIIYIGIFMLLLAGCQDEGMFTPESDGDEPVYVTYRVHMGDETLSRAIGDANKVNELKVGVFQDNQLLKIFTFDKDENAEAFTNVTLPLLKQETYDLVFWAQKKDNGIYSIDENFNITIDYAKYQEISLAGTEDFEAFTVVKEDVSVANPGDATITLTRPFAQLNIAASEDDIFNKVNKVSFTIDKVYKKFNPLTGVSSEEVTGQEFSYSFSSQDIAAKQAITIDGTNYYYLASAYLLAPEKVNLTGGLYKDTELIKELNVTELPLKANSRTNIYGNMIQQEELQGWDGVIPAQSPLTQDEQNRYIIDEEADLAWLSVPSNVASLSASTFFVDKDVLNMGDKPISSIQLPAGSTFDGNGKTIKYYANSLFGDAANITVQNLNLDNVTATSESHVGVLVNTLIGNGTFTNVSISNSSATTTDGAAGGMVGYIVRASETDRSETLEVKIENCNISQTTVSSDKENEGQFVGLLSGYDNGEKLTFKTCTATDVQVPGTYHDFLGNETYRRGAVTVEDKRFMPKWDGKTSVVPLLANPTYDGANAIAGTNKFVVYSSFDLAGVRKKTASPAAIYLKADIDMNGQGADGKYNVPSNFTQSAQSSADDNVFDPFSYVTTLDGYKDDESNYSIYNLSIAQIEQDRAAFILYASGTTVHKNINFRNCQTVAVHKPVATDAKAYGAILVSNVDATYTMENVHAYYCKVFALQKVGTLGARISGTSTLKNNSVNNCYVENYECMISERFDSGEKEALGFKVRVYADFYPHGEVGGMYGFIQGKSTLINCMVNSTIVYAFGQNDKKATVEGDGAAQAGIWALGYYLVPGRHVSTMIGNIRATGAVTLTNCKVNSNSKCTNRWDKHQWRVQTGGSWWNPKYTYYKYDYIGQAYYVKFVDSEGSVTVDGSNLTVGDCKDDTLYGTK